MRKDLEDPDARLKAQGKPPAVPRDADPLLDPGDLMEMVNAGTYPITFMQSKIAKSKLEVVPEAGHAFFLEKPQTFNQTLEAFLGAP